MESRSFMPELPLACYLLILAAYFTAETEACLASGICGPPGLGGLGCMHAQPTMGMCAAGGCPPGYQCGPYGCALRRARARSSNTMVAAGQQGWSTTEEEEKPKVIFLPVGSQRVPSGFFNQFTELLRMYLKQDACPVQASAEIQFCAAQGRDHRECCARNVRHSTVGYDQRVRYDNTVCYGRMQCDTVRYGMIKEYGMTVLYDTGTVQITVEIHFKGVTTTLAGSKCLVFCDQRPGNVTQLDVSYVSCYDRFDSMKRCFWHDLMNRLDNEARSS
ncbi:unnamed protein product [Anisakis simplex]|uniref:DB domain-containing protein n=1 Tax=Anisakis simplex TaxID=6269 RepID=A0A0M3KCI3_ANISI|nr:unnamed protein product [Anisakis simplex]